MKIQINAVSGITTKQGKFKPYSQYDIEFLDLESGRPRKKHMVDFNGPKAYEALKEAKVGQCFEITEQPGKDPQYTDWVDATPITVETPVEASKGSGGASDRSQTTTTSFKSSYETPEERARKQVYIVRQSSLTNAIATLALNQQRTAGKEEVVDIAKFYEAYVFGVQNTEQDSTIPTVD